MQAVNLPAQVPDSGIAGRLGITAGACSVQGALRETNEDSQYISPDMHLFVVADGMGGHAAGEVASRFAVDVLSHDLAQIAAGAGYAEVERQVRLALGRANCLILDSVESEPDQKGAGTTVVLALLLNHRLYIAGVGDSRAYLVRRGNIERLTIDDTWPDALLQLGQISADQAKQHHMRNVLMSALGMKAFNSNHEEIRVLDVYHDDRYLLASDGLTDAVDDAQISEIIARHRNPQRAAEMLTQHAIDVGAVDDVTCVVFYVDSV